MRILYIFLLCLITPCLWAAPTFSKSNQASVLTPEEAFEIKVAQVSDQNITLDIAIAPGTYLYQKAFKFTADTATLGSVNYPVGESIEDPYFGKVNIFRHNLALHIPITSASYENFQLTVNYQGCNDRGFCYPPQETTLTIQAGAHNPTNQALNLLQNMPTAWALAAFFGFGLLLAFTPCVLPMIPILSSLIIGEQHKHHRGHAFGLALTYVLSMAAAYAALGATVASLGARVQAQLQHPVLLSITAGILIIMAILLFNDKALAFVSRLNEPLHKLSHKMHTGKTFGVMMMGILSALIVSPCVTPPLIGALTYISLTGNVILGASALFLLALGMGVPLLMVSWGGTALLPKRGPWLNYVKHAFALILVLMAASLIARFAAPTWNWREPLGMQEQVSHLPFVYVDSIESLDKALAQAKQDGKPVMLDFYADWCTNCITLEHSVFTDEVLSSQWKQLVLLKVDVTHYNSATQALMSQWHVYGPPALIFFNAQGKPVPDARVDGLVTAHELSEKIHHLLEKRR